MKNQLDITLNQIINIARLFHKSEIIHYRNEYSIFNHNKPDIVLPNETSLFVEYGILQLDSGNFETGQQSYILEPDKDKLKENIIKLTNKRGVCNFDNFAYLIRDKKISQILGS